jgi:hypothetical protein
MPLAEEPMENTPASPIEERIRAAFPEVAIDRVQVLAHGDDPGVEPEQTAARVLLGRAGRPEGLEADKEILKAFTDASGHHAALKQLSDELPFIAWIEFLPYLEDESTRHGGPLGRGPVSRFSPRGGQAGQPNDPQDQLTPVMTRLGTADLAAVDTLIAAGIAGSRAELLRWAVGRIREHPAYAQIQDRVHEISELKAQF